jgi:hypothetical protein
LGISKTWNSTGFRFRAFAFHNQYKYPPLPAPTLRTSSIPIIFADDNSVLISGKNLDDFCMLSNKVLSQVSKWFSANRLSLNLEKTNVIEFIAKNSQYPLNVDYSFIYIYIYRRGRKPKIP